MSKFLTEVSRGHVIALSMLMILTGLFLSAPSPCRAANPSESYEFVSEIELAAPLPTEIKVEDVQIQNTIRISYVCTNAEYSPVPWNISQGKVVWKSENLTVQSANITDNSGESFPLLNYSGYIMNPPLEGMIKPNSTYVLTLTMVFMPGALYSDSYQAWEFGTVLNSALPTEANITLPVNFSVPFRGIGARYSKGENHKIYTWQNSLGEPLNISVVFLPFPYNPQTIFLNFSSDISSVFPIWGGAMATETQEFTSLSEYNGFVVPQIFEIPVMFPPTSDNNTQVTSVCDSEGPCAKLPERLSEVNYSNSGKYYPDKVNQVVYVYPRATSTENLYDYIVTVTFDLGKLLPFNATLKDKLLRPYDCISRYTINLKPSGDWELNLTQGTIVQFWLPQGTQPDERPNYKTYYDSAKGRWSVTFVNASSEWTTGIWEIDFSILRLRDLFNWEIISIVYLAIIVVLAAVLRFVKPANFLGTNWKLHLEKWKLHLGNKTRRSISYLAALGIGPGLFVYEVTGVLGDWFWDVIPGKTVFTVLLIVQGCLTIAAPILVNKWVWQQTTSEASRPYIT